MTFAPLGRGGNSRLYRAELATGERVAVKSYPLLAADRLDRLEAEVGALAFLVEQGVDRVPRVVAAAREERCALFTWLDGVPLATPREADIDAAVNFLTGLHALRKASGAARLPQAAEACLSAAELERQLIVREERLAAVGRDSGLAAFLDERFYPARGQLSDWARCRYGEAGLDFTEELALEKRTLSPSDFGFHNALVGADGRLFFVDFEYFGWDDPVKLTADFLWHPGMSLDESLKWRFAAAQRAVHAADGSFGPRLEALFPLYGLRWCMILLNEFLSEGWARRAHATGKGGGGRLEVKQRQLKRAHRLLDEVLRTYERFPY